MIKKVLTIAGSDCSGGAGIQADLKTMMAHKIYGMSVITAITAQNTIGVYGVVETSPEFVAQQIDCIFNDIRPDAVKIGMVSNRAIIEVIVEKLLEHKATNIVVDPVMISTSGSRLLSDGAIDVLVKKLLPIATVITPNIGEAEALAGFKVKSEYDMIKAARLIYKMQKGGVLIKGGHLKNTANDLLYMDEKCTWFNEIRIENPNTHGTGCTLSSAIACNLATGLDLEKSIEKAKKYLTGALKANADIGKGSGPLDHAYSMRFQIF